MSRSLARTTLGLFAPILAVTSAACSGGAPGESVGESGEAVVVHQGPNVVEGIDVSRYQGTINWAQVKASGRGFAITSVGDGTYQDPTFAANWAGMKAAGLIRGAYQFFEPGEDPIVQANILLGKVGTLGAGDLPPMLDVEVTGGQSAATITTRIGQWIAHVKAATGMTPLIYTGKYFWNDNVGSNAFASNPLVIAAYGPPAPDTPTAWSTWKFWQYSSTGSVSGISGNVDLDRFNGTMAELAALGGPLGKSPDGYLDSASCDAIVGWSQDPDTKTSAVDVHVYFDGLAGAAGAQDLAVAASVVRSDLCAPLGTCNHGFSLPTPRGLMDGKAHDVHAYGMDTAGGTAGLLTGAKSFTCAPPPAPFTMAVKRHVVSSASFKSWRFSLLVDVAHYTAADVAALADGPDVPVAPLLMQADDGTPEVWVVDGTSRRHVQDPASLAAWRFDPASIKKTPAATVYALDKGNDWPHAPFLVEGATTDDYMIDGVDVAPPSAADAGPGAASPDVPPPATVAPQAADGGGGGGGCAASGHPASEGSAWMVLLGAAAAFARRRRRNA